MKKKTKVTKELVKEMKALKKEGHTQAQIAKIVKIGRSTVGGYIGKNNK